MVPDLQIFVSVGATATAEQEDFVRAVEDRLRSEGLTPHTVGRNTFSSDAPLKAVTELMKTCVGTVVIALERSYFPAGVAKRGGPNEVPLREVRLPTPWNQIEAAIAYSAGRPLMVIVQAGIQKEGLLEQGYDWYVQEVRLERSALTSMEFNGVFASWKNKVLQPKPTEVAASNSTSSKSSQDMTIGELVGGLKPAQLWSVLAAIAGLIAGAFAVGGKLFSK